MARLITTTRRDKVVYNLSLEEFKKGEWLAAVPESDMVEVSYRQNYLTITDFKVQRTADGRTEKEPTEKEDEE
jgi:hypothetical protein